MNHRTSLARRAALLIVVTTLGLPRIDFALGRPMPLQTRERSRFKTPAQPFIQSLVLYPALRTALVSSSIARSS